MRWARRPDVYAQDVSDREPFPAFDDALRSWGKLDGEDLRHARTIVELLAVRLGSPHSVYIGQDRNAIGLSCGASRLVDVYVSPEKLDVAPHATSSVRS